MNIMLDILRYIALLSSMGLMLYGEFTAAIGIVTLIIAERVIFIADHLHKS